MSKKIKKKRNISLVRSSPAINQHLRRIYEDNELTREATLKQYLIVQTKGNREVRREVEHYSLQAIIAVGFKIENERAVQFRKWANQIVKDYTIQGWTMDVYRLKQGGTFVYQAEDGKLRIDERFEKKLHRTATHKESLTVRHESPRSLGPKLFALNNLVDQMPVSELKFLRKQP
jgi:hypothetical protein